MSLQPKECIRCLLRDMSEADLKNIDKYKQAIKQVDRVSEEVYENRLDECKKCERLNAGTCNACGCYVEIRALAKNSSCPYSNW